MAMLNVSIVGKIVGIFDRVRLFTHSIRVGVGVVQSIDEGIRLAFTATTDRVKG